MSGVLQAAALALALLAGDEPPRPRPLREPGRDGLIVARLPYGKQQQYRVFEAKCSKCHELSRALDADFSADKWAQYLRKKARRTGARFSAKQQEDIYQFLAWWSERRQQE